MARPVTITVNAMRWTIKRRKLDGVWGRCDWPERVIWLDPELTGLALVNTLTHEVMHAADYETEELRAEVLAASLTQALVKLGLLSEDGDGEN
jgi:hypothetical protein